MLIYLLHFSRKGSKLILKTQILYISMTMCKINPIKINIAISIIFKPFIKIILHPKINLRKMVCQHKEMRDLKQLLHQYINQNTR